MKKISYAVRSAVAVAALAAAAVASAGPCGGMGGEGFGPGMGMGRGPGMGPGMMMGPGMGPGYGMGWGSGRGAGDHSAVVDGRLASMKSALKITAAQESQWEAFTGTWKSHATNMGTMREKAWQGSGSAADRMSLRAEGMQQRAAEMGAMSKAFAQLYAVLTPEQKAVADEYFGRGGPYATRYSRRAG